MRRLAILISAVSLILSGAVQAAPEHRPGGGHNRPAPHRPAPHRPPGHRPPAHRPPAHRPPHVRPPHIIRPPAHRPPGHRPGIHPPHHKPGFKPNPGWHGGGRPGHGYRPPRGHQFYYRNHWINRIRGSAFIYPHGYHYRRWYAGQTLPLLFLGSSYLFTDYGALGISVPPPGYAWVRYGPDLLLVNTSTGEVDQVLYGVYY